LRTIEDADKIKSKLKKSKPVIVGAGLLGCELADVMGGTLIEDRSHVLSGFDPEFSDAIEELLSKKVKILKNTRTVPNSDFVVSAVGVRPDISLAKNSGIASSEFGIIVDEKLETSMKNVYAAGDCIEERCFFTGKPMHSYLGPQSERQGIIAGKNAAGSKMAYSGSLNAVVSKIAGYEIGMTGLCSDAAKKAGLKATTGRIKAKTKPDYDKNAKDLLIKMVFDGKRLVGCMAMGEEGVEGIINLASYAMQHSAMVDDLIDLAYCYSPPICSAPNPIILCAENAKRRMKK
jgi:NADPH-dependent 2,4-dienoyl-CoA reductase/sulfur reductase-like enzyme